MPDSAAPPLLGAALEVALNRYLALEAAALEDCGRLAGRTLALHTRTPDWTFLIEFHGGGVRVSGDPTRPADVTVSGPATELLRLAWSGSQGGSGIPQGLQIDGDVELLERFNRILAAVGFDPEELAAGVLGDAAAHRLTRGLRSVFGWTRRAGGTLALDTAEYLREETRDLARSADVEDWMNEVDDLREGVDRFEARIRRLERHLPEQPAE